MDTHASPYELSTDFQRTKAALRQDQLEKLNQRFAYVKMAYPEGQHQRNVRIEDACCGHLREIAERFWHELLEPASLSNERRSELFQRAIDEAFDDVRRPAQECGGYEVVADFRDHLLQGHVAVPHGDLKFSNQDTHQIIAAVQPLPDELRVGVCEYAYPVTQQVTEETSGVTTVDGVMGVKRNPGGRPREYREIDGAELNRRRGKKSQKAFARLCGISEDSLQKAESGLATLRTLKKICKFLKTKPEELKKNMPQKLQ
jgi:DNA-binding Xre family transcriptional regulator